MRFAQKRAVVDYVTGEPIFCFADFYRGRAHSALVTYLGNSPSNPADLFVYDLAHDPDELRELPEDELAERIARAPKVIRHLRANAAPIIMPSEDAPMSTKAVALGAAELERRVEVLQSDADLIARLCGLEEGVRKEFDKSEHVEGQIYDSFINDVDKPHMDDFHRSPWETRVAILEKLQDQRLKRLGKRLIYLERPDCLPAVDRAEIALEFANRISNSDEFAPWLTGDRAIWSADTLINEADGDEVIRLTALRSFLIKIVENAKKLSQKT